MADRIEKYLNLKPDSINFVEEILLPLSNMEAILPKIVFKNQEGILGSNNGLLSNSAIINVKSLFVIASGATPLYTPEGIYSLIIFA